MHNMKFSLALKVLCVFLTLEASRASADSGFAKNVNPALPNATKPILDVAQAKVEPSAENDNPVAASDAVVIQQQQDVNKTSEMETSTVNVMIQKQLEMLKQPGMRRLARQLNRFHQGQLFASMRRSPILLKDDDNDDDAIAEERAVRRRTRIRRRNSNNKVKSKRRKTNSKKSTPRKKNSKNSFRRKGAKGAKNQKRKSGLRSGNKKGAKGVKKTKRNKQGQKNSKRRMSNRKPNNRRNRRRNSAQDDEDIEDTAWNRN